MLICLLGEPRGKGRPRARIIKSKAGAQFVGVYTDAKTRSYESLLRDAADKAMDGAPLLEGALAVKVTARFSVPKSWSKIRRTRALCGEIRPTGRPDFDNLVKVLDALNGVVWRDDSQIVHGVVSKVYDGRPRLEIVVSAVFSLTLE